VSRSAIDEEALFETVLDAGADDVGTDDPESYEITTPLAQFESVKAALTKRGVTPTSVEIAKVPQNTIALTDKDAEQALKLMEALEDHDDVQRISSNLDIADEVLQKLQP
jgi:transcriptional/translational regulatory protein YebC/TACO1